MKKEKFISPTLDIVFKTLWTRGNKYVRRYLERMVEYALGHPLKEYTLSYNELGKISIESIANKVDILLVSKDGLEKTNIEMNRVVDRNNGVIINTIMNKSDIYLSTIVSTFYDDKGNRRYKEPIKVEQVNFNTFYFGSDKDIAKLSFEFVDRKYNIVKDGIKTHHLYLPALRDMCYNESEIDIYKDFALLMANGYKEMEELALGNKEREEVVKVLKEMNGDVEFMAIIDREEYNRILLEVEKEEQEKQRNELEGQRTELEGQRTELEEQRTELEEQRTELKELEKTLKEREEAINKHFEQGIEKAVLDSAKMFYQNGVSKEIILKSLDIEENVLDAIIEEVDSNKS